MMRRAFPDLRVVAAAQANDESIWPSFTDIMSVITMVFIMAMVVFSIRSFDLSNRLGAASSSNQDLRLKLEELELSLSQTQRFLLQSELNLQQSEQDLEQSQKKFEQSEQQNVTLASRIDALEESETNINQKLRLNNQKLAELRRLLAQNDAEKVSLVLEKEDLSSQIDSLQLLFSERVRENADLQQQIVASLGNYQSLQQQYDSLDERYRVLVRPARSAENKYVVTIYIGQEDGNVAYQYRLPDETEVSNISKEKLFQLLQTMKDEQGDDLYTRNIIRENSVLTYDEGHRLIEEILNRFDYYYN